MAQILGEYVGRLAPSPTGALHLGNVRTFMIAWLRARIAGGKLLLRIEDLDHPRDKPGAAAQAIADLRWLGFDWDGEVVQSTRLPVYRAALASLRRQHLVYPCVCTRRDVETAQSAPHAGDQLRYFGTCRGRFTDYRAAQAVKSDPCWRFRVEAGTPEVCFVDGFAGPYSQDVAGTLGDFALARHPDGAGYTLAVVADDLLGGITEVVRGDDLLPATPAQLMVARALSGDRQFLDEVSAAGFAVPAHLRPPDYFHVPLMVGADGLRLAKRHGDTRVDALRADGMEPEQLLGYLASTCGWCAPGRRTSLVDLLEHFDPATIPHTPVTIDRQFVRPFNIRP